MTPSVRALLACAGSLVRSRGMGDVSGLPPPPVAQRSRPQGQDATRQRSHTGVEGPGGGEAGTTCTTWQRIQVCRQVGLAPATLQGGGCTARHIAARAGIAYLWTEVLSHPGRPLAGVLGVCPAAVYKAARRGAAQAPTWQRLLGRARQEA